MRRRRESSIRHQHLFAQVVGGSAIFVDHAFDRHRCQHDRHVPAAWFLQNHLLACTKTHFRGHERMSTKHWNRQRQHQNRKKSSRIYMMNWKTSIIGVQMDADMMGINRWKWAPGGVNFAYELPSETQNRASWTKHRSWSTHDGWKMIFVRFNWGFILKVDMRSASCKKSKTKKVFISQAAVRISFEHDATTSSHRYVTSIFLHKSWVAVPFSSTSINIWSKTMQTSSLYADNLIFTKPLAGVYQNAFSGSKTRVDARYTSMTSTS